MKTVMAIMVANRKEEAEKKKRKRFKSCSQVGVV